MYRGLGPTTCIEEKPTPQSIQFGGRYISLAKLAARGGFDKGYLSYIFSGTRTPSLAYAIRVAQELGMGLEDFLSAIEARHEEITDRQRRLAG